MVLFASWYHLQTKCYSRTKCYIISKKYISMRNSVANILQTFTTLSPALPFHFIWCQRKIHNNTIFQGQTQFIKYILLREGCRKKKPYFLWSFAKPVALGDRFWLFIQTLNNDKKPFNSIFNSKTKSNYSFKEFIHSKTKSNYSFKEFIHSKTKSNYSFKELFIQNGQNNPAWENS